MSLLLNPDPLHWQIISFLQQNAHPRVAERTPAVPENVTDQVSHSSLCSNICNVLKFLLLPALIPITFDIFVHIQCKC